MLDYQLIISSIEITCHNLIRFSRRLLQQSLRAHFVADTMPKKFAISFNNKILISIPIAGAREQRSLTMLGGVASIRD